MLDAHPWVSAAFIPVPAFIVLVLVAHALVRMWHRAVSLRDAQLTFGALTGISA